MTTAKQLLTQKNSQYIISVSPDQSTYEALKMMADKEVGAIAVIENEELIGILTEREYARKVILHGKASKDTPVRETMNSGYPTVEPDTRIEECMRIISELRFRYLAVKENQKLIGIISIGDLLKNVIANQQADIEHLERYITGV